MQKMTKQILGRLKQAKRLEQLRNEHPGCQVSDVANGLVVICEDIHKPWEEVGPSYIPEPRPEQKGECPAEPSPKKHPIDRELEERKKVEDFWNKLK